MIVQRAGLPVRIGEVVIIPLERMTLTGSRGRGGIRGYASLVPAGVAVISHGDVEVMNEMGERIPSEECLREITGLREAIARGAGVGRSAYGEVHQ